MLMSFKGILFILFKHVKVSLPDTHFTFLYITGGHTEVVRLLLAAGAQANGYDNILVTPLHLTAQGN